MDKQNIKDNVSDFLDFFTVVGYCITEAAHNFVFDRKLNPIIKKKSTVLKEKKKSKIDKQQIKNLENPKRLTEMADFLGYDAEQMLRYAGVKRDKLKTTEKA